MRSATQGSLVFPFPAGPLRRCDDNRARESLVSMGTRLSSFANLSTVKGAQSVLTQGLRDADHGSSRCQKRGLSCPLASHRCANGPGVRFSSANAGAASFRKG